jgi:hypothetical protein
VQALNTPAEYEREMRDKLAELRKMDGPVAAAGAAYVQGRLDRYTERSQQHLAESERQGRVASVLNRLYDAVQGRREWQPEHPPPPPPRVEHHHDSGRGL